MSQKEPPPPTRIDRRQFVELFAGSLALASASCGRSRNRAPATSSTIGDFEAAIFIVFPDGTFGHLAFFGETNPIGYRNSQTAELLNREGATMDPAEIDRIYRQLWSVFQLDLPATFLYPGAFTTVASPRVRGLSGPYRADPVWYMEELWLEDER